MNPRIVVVGSANTDMVVQVGHLPKPGETVLGGTFATVQGGKGANQAVAAQRLGADVTFVARLGRDDFGQRAYEAYQAEGLNLDFLVWDDGAPSGIASITVDAKGENCIAVASGANARLTPGDVAAAEAQIAQADCLLLQLEVPLPTVEAAAKLAQKHGVRVILNPAPAAELPAELLAMVDILTPNETELAMLAQATPAAAIAQAAAAYHERLGLDVLIVTLGEQGALLLDGERQMEVPAFQITPVDTTAAGDSFNGALAVALAKGEDLAAATRFANAAAGLAATKAGAQPSLPNLAEVEAFLTSGPVAAS